MTIEDEKHIDEVKYILIDSKTSELVWDGPEDGLLFLLRNNETFMNALSNPQVNIWQVR